MRARAIPALAVVLATASCGMNLQNAGVGTGISGPSKQITAVFSDAGRLPLGGVVRAGQAEVGRVTAIRTRDFRALVQMDVEADVDLPRGTTAQLQLASPLGEAFVMLDRPPGGPMLEDGAVIPIERTTRGPDIEDTLAAVGTVLNGSGLDQARTVVGELSTALRGREGEVRDLLHQLQEVLGSLQRHRDDIDHVLAALHSTSEELARNKPLLEATFTQVKPGVDVLLAERDRFGALLAGTASLSATADSLTRRTAGTLTGEVRQLRPVLDELRGFDGHLASTLDGLARFSQLFQRATPGDYVLFNGTLDVPGTLGEVVAPGRSGP
ncbi:MCE family protein [Saccharopolyspora flava]|uniref:Phospholipid/cholesterol/gamma-HCH transport system substrate-binding protein n=1 Tax=Saccharopolyspora flava TaxID=95161 RepID=A0A1I6SBV9_9PSEU|nr:MCE family protein [Saccharopolyspora flava]SFS74451.1 phospholipid/cholesterol/gamma-HCH transport system substrate-binding protein [Saccharopolyspora flava]